MRLRGLRGKRWRGLGWRRSCRRGRGRSSGWMRRGGRGRRTDRYRKFLFGSPPSITSQIKLDQQLFHIDMGWQVSLKLIVLMGASNRSSTKDWFARLRPRTDPTYNVGGGGRRNIAHCIVSGLLLPHPSPVAFASPCSHALSPSLALPSLSPSSSLLYQFRLYRSWGTDQTFEDWATLKRVEPTESW